MIVVFFAIVSLLGWGTGDIFTTFASRKMGSYNSTFYGYLFGGLLAAFYIPLALNTWKSFNISLIFLTLILTIIKIIAVLAYNEGLKIGNSSIVGTIAGAFTSVVVILSLLFLGEKLSAMQSLSIIIIFAGLFLSSVNFSDLRNKKSIINKGTVFALIATFGWGVYGTFIKIPVREVGFFWPSFMENIIGIFYFMIFGLKRIKKQSFGIQSGFLAVFLSGVLLTTASFSFNFAIGQGLSSIVAPIAGAYPALFALLAYFIFKDPSGKHQKLGMITTLLGIILLAYFSR